MKKFNKVAIFVLSLCTYMMLSSCEEDIDKFIVTDSEPVVLSELSITDIELDPVNGSNPAVTFNWTDADYGQQTVVNYALEFSSDAEFTNPSIVGSVNSINAITLSVAELNSAVGSVGLPPFEWNMVYARIISSLGNQSGLPVASNTISFSAYPYFNYPFKDFYLVGDATQPGWNNNNNNPPLFRSGSNPNEYNYVGYFGAGQFKVLEVKGLWQPQWGTNNGTTIDVNPGTGTDPGTFPLNNTAISAAGYYKFTINYSTNTFSFSPYSTAGAPNFSSITIQGTASAATPMIQSSFDSHIWYVNGLSLNPGNLQFVTNTSAVWAGTTSFSGTAVLNGGSIPVVVGDEYDVWFNDLTGHYIMIPLNL
jgi:hypothetical protein